ncbi:MAG: hypothetical protein Q4D13_02120 [Erysipelotrichaceae bacterium]|nr:hypothetical protein [Erysipelotrichaceae bacterium]
MAKIVKKKRRRLSFNGFAIVLFVFSLTAFLISNLLINTINTNLTIKIQKLTDELNTLKSDNQNLSFEIQSLENKERVYVIAQAANMNQTQENIVSVTGE